MSSKYVNRAYQTLKRSNMNKLHGLHSKTKYQLVPGHEQAMENYIWRYIKFVRIRKLPVVYTDELIKVFPNRKKDGNIILGFLAACGQENVLADTRCAVEEKVNPEIYSDYFDNILLESQDYVKGSPIVLDNAGYHRHLPFDEYPILNTPLHYTHYNPLTVVWKIIQEEMKESAGLREHPARYERRVWRKMDSLEKLGIIPEVRVLIVKDLNRSLLHCCSQRGAVSVMFNGSPLADDTK